jgi:hypothetical protein
VWGEDKRRLKMNEATTDIGNEILPRTGEGPDFKGWRVDEQCPNCPGIPEAKIQPDEPGMGICPVCKTPYSLESEN